MKAVLLDHMGSDLSVVNAARVSFDKTSEWEEPIELVGNFGDYRDLPRRLPAADEKLIRYLAKHDHWTPFAHTSLSFRMSAPVPIRTQCFKHKAGFVENEESRRYISGKPEVFMPAELRSAPTGSIKQGSAGVHPHSTGWLADYYEQCEGAVHLYEAMINDGVCPEQARFVLPQGALVNWIWTGNLAAFARFYNLRTDPHAQLEIQELAREVGSQIAPLFPTSWKALTC